MTYVAPNRLLLPGAPTIDSGQNGWIHAANASASALWPTASLAIYVPVAVPRPVVVRQLWVYCSPPGTGSFDMGLYLPDGAGILAATASTLATGRNEFDVTDTLIGPGYYYIGASCSTTDTGIARFSITAPIASAHGVLTEASAYPLPTNATFAILPTLAYVPVLGLELGVL